MGINIGTATFLTKSDLINSTKALSPDKRCKLLMIGRQTMSTRSTDQPGLAKYNPRVRASSLEINTYAEDFLTDLGATIIESLDYSDFESAEIIHNLNQSFEGSKIEHLKNSFDLVLDYGTSEHVFQAAQSISNSISLVRVGGRLNMVLPVCGYLEHGFYQFSPNFFRALEGKYLRLIQMYIYEPYTGTIQIWNAKNLPDVPFFERLDGRYLCWTVYEKISEFDENDFLLNTQQGVYKRAWENTRKDLAKERESMSAFSKFKNNAVKNYYFLQRYFMYSKKITKDQIEKILISE
jgi:hypothetical protein